MISDLACRAIACTMCGAVPNSQQRCHDCVPEDVEPDAGQLRAGADVVKMAVQAAPRHRRADPRGNASSPSKSNP
jgi:hypothetical protein